MKKLFLVLLTTTMLGAPSAWAQSLDVLLEVDLGVENQVTIRAVTGNSAATISGSDVTGVYLEGFYGMAGTSLDETLVSGDLVAAANTSDGTPNLFRGGSFLDPGLNIWSMSGSSLSFTAGAQAFTGSGIWTLTPANYADMVAGAQSGDLYFPADTEDDVAGATLIGRWVRVGGVLPPASPSVPIPTLSGLGLALLLLAVSWLGLSTLRRA